MSKLAMSNFETLLSKNNMRYSEKWSPTSVSDFENELKNGSYYGMNKETRKNIVYSLQYLQFLQLQLEELNMHSVISTQVMKTYIVTAMSIIESVFMHIVKKNNCQKKTDWQVTSTRCSNAFVEDGIRKKYVISVEEELATPIEEKMNLEFLIQQIFNKNLLSLSHASFPYLKSLRKIRNKVHLFLVRYENDTDFLGIDHYDYLTARHLLYKTLTDPVFALKKNNRFLFLKLKTEQLEALRLHLKSEKQNT